MNRSWKQGFHREAVEAKQGNYLIGQSLSGFVWGEKPSCLFCDWLFLNLEAFTEIHPGLGFDLLTQTTRALEPLQWPPCLVTFT